MKSKKSISVLLVIATVISIIAIFSSTASAATLTLNELKSKFPEGKYWNHYCSSASDTSNYCRNKGYNCYDESVSDTPCWSHSAGGYNAYIGHYDCNRYSGATQCCGFAKKISSLAYGSVCTSWPTKRLSAGLKRGDVIWYNTGNSYGHWVTVVNVSNNIITVGECNWGGKCIIKWSRTININNISIKAIYNAPSELKLTAKKTYCYIIYNANGGSNGPGRQKVESGTSFKIPNKTPTRSSYVFLGWSAQKTGNVSRYGAPGEEFTATKSTILYAQWFLKRTLMTNYTTTALTSGKKYFISPACATGSVLDANGTENGANVSIWAKHGGTNQQWTVYKYGNYYYFVNVAAKKSLDINSGYAVPHRNAEVYQTNKTTNQLWRLISAGDGYYYIQSAMNPAYYLDISEGSSANGTNVGIYIQNKSKAQKFRFTAVPTITSFSTNFKMKSGAYTDAYSNYNLSTKVGRVFTNDVVTVKKVYSNGVVQLICPWEDSSGSYNRTVYCKLTNLKFKATKKIQAYSSINGNTCGFVFVNDVVTVKAISNSNGTIWMKAICPWTGGTNKTIYIKCNTIY